MKKEEKCQQPGRPSWNMQAIWSIKCL